MNKKKRDGVGVNNNVSQQDGLYFVLPASVGIAFQSPVCLQPALMQLHALVRLSNLRGGLYGGRH
jgi:hypothetical protein